MLRRTLPSPKPQRAKPPALKSSTTHSAIEAGATVRIRCKPRVPFERSHRTTAVIARVHPQHGPAISCMAVSLHRKSYTPKKPRLRVGRLPIRPKKTLIVPNWPQQALSVGRFGEPNPLSLGYMGEQKTRGLQKRRGTSAPLSTWTSSAGTTVTSARRPSATPWRQRTTGRALAWCELGGFKVDHDPCTQYTRIYTYIHICVCIYR